MRKWAVVVVALYGISLIVLTMPALIAGFWDPAEGGPTLDDEILKSVYYNWPYWLGVCVFLLSQAALLIIPVRVSLKKPTRTRPVWLPIITSAFLMAILIGSFIMAVSEAVRGKAFADENIWLYISLAVLLATWAIWGFVFYKWSMKLEPGAFVAKVCRWLFTGSVLELLVAVPTHIVVRNRNYCCAGIGTFCGITAGIAVMLLSFGPGVFFLFVERWKRLRPDRS